MINEVPAATPVITPVEEFIIALAVVPLVHTPPVVVLVKVVVDPTQTDCDPVSSLTVGRAFTVTVRVAVQTQPLTFITEYLISELPAEMPVKTPVEAFIVALAVVPLVQTPSPVALAKVKVDPTHTAFVPVMASTVTKAFTDVAIPVL